MRNKFIYFGEQVEGFDRPVLNEREARAGAGILLLPAIISFINAYITHNFLFTQIFITIFMIDFTIRVLINPKFAPTMILGRIIVQKQKPEYVGAIQKRFAWSIGLILSVIMFVIVVILELMTPIKIAICLLCIAFLFSETAFGICFGCVIYNYIFKEPAKYCAGGSCEIREKEEIQKISKLQLTLLIVSILAITGISFSLNQKIPQENQHIMRCGGDMKCGAGK